MEVMPVYAPANPVTLYNHNGECVGRWVPETGRGLIGDCFVVKERSCELIETEIEHPNGVKMRGAFCTACGHMHEGELGWFWEFCPKCGARRVE